ncbi:MAG: hypothetical protein ACRD2S_09355 [Terriglobales bacterium]
MSKRLQFAALILVGLALLTIPMPTFAQGCALCYTQAASAGSRMIQALRSGILVLIVPPSFLSVGVAIIAYRKRNQFKREGYTVESDERW